jgi:hypothetical protein
MTRARESSPLLATSVGDRAGLPAERAFVIQLRADADLARGVVRGRIEHVVSGTSARFESVDELLDCMRDIVARRSPTA